MGEFIPFQYINHYEVLKGPSQHVYDLNNFGSMWGTMTAS